MGCGGGGEIELSDYPEPTIVTAAPDGADEDAVDDILEINRRQARAIGERDWQALYDTFSSRQQTACPYPQFVAAAERSAQGAEGFDISLFSFDHIAIDIEGDRAELAYVSRYDGRVVQVVAADDPDVFVEIEGVWYDEVDAHAPFGC